MNEKKTLVLTGFMGSGKSTIGRMLSIRLGMPFIDLDTEIEQGEKAQIPEIFEKKGEGYFREREHHYLSKYLDGPPVVLSLGGGALNQERNFHLIRQKSIIVYLEVPVEELFRRLKKDKNRPLLRDEKGQLLNDPFLHQRISSMLEKRQPAYQKADLKVSIHPDWNKTETTNEVIRILSEHVPAARIAND